VKVYLSSTLIDLKPERQAVKDALGGECIVVESYTADERCVGESCLADVSGCDLYIGIVGMRYGAIATGTTCSITELEFREARMREIPTWIFIKDIAYVPDKFRDAVSSRDGSESIEAFRATLTSGADGAPRPAVFTTPEDLAVQVLKALARVRRPGGGPKRRRIIGNPYPGPRAFRTDEADRFFGRDDEVAELLDRLLDKDQRFVALIGASGSGKSSLVYAGLIPQLTEGPAGLRWIVVTVTPRKLRDDPFLSLAAGLDRQFSEPCGTLDDLEQRLREHPADIAAVATQALSNIGTDTRLLLFVDQFEELFAHKVKAGARTAFFALIAAAVACPLIRVVISMRADFYAQWPQDDASMKLLRDGHFPVAVPGQVALAKMITEPAEAAELHFEPSQLVQRILDETGTAPGALVLVMLALSQLYTERAGNALTEVAYTTTGGVAGVIERQAELAASQAEQAIARSGDVIDGEAWSRLFVAIASVEPRERGLVVVRRRAVAGELTGAALLLAKHLVDKRLLVSSGGDGDQPAVYEVGHEAVFSHWKRFTDWSDRYANDLAARQQVERAAAEWHRAGRPAILRWGWERQKPALKALHKLSHLPLPASDADYHDTGIMVWRSLQAAIKHSPLGDFLDPEPLALIAELSLEPASHQRREEIGLRLNQLGDPRRGLGLDAAGLPDIAWIDVPAGRVTLGIEAAGLPRDIFAVEPFQLARYPVTWCQYLAFVNADDGYGNWAWWNGLAGAGEHGTLIWAFANHPVVNVSWYEAMAYCRWLSAKQGLYIRLPTEIEWQWAAVADSGQAYPWQGAWNAARANSGEAGIGRSVAAGMYPLGRSPSGFDDMAGEVSEWCLNMFNNPKSFATDTAALRAHRGGSWNADADALRTFARGQSAPAYRDNSIGFRVCRIPSNKNWSAAAPAA